MSLSLQEGSGISRTQDLTWKCLKGVADAVTSFLKRVWIFICVNHITELFLIWKDLENIDTACTCYTTKIIGGQQILPVTAHWSHQPQQPGLIYQTCKAMRLCYGFRLKKTTKNMHYIQDKWSYAHDFAGWVSDCKTRGFPATAVLGLVPISLASACLLLGFCFLVVRLNIQCTTFKVFFSRRNQGKNRFLFN